ncbi:hypothetical protein L1987_19590 [Smallanthus sonchifolius]|uniref:Uncharacterized protein n=1 Tax=Smallanthus sonchifolius TaxID=185202 RepID=A0ACB9IPQ1_9ASTR|nr:hypothetical protein L1987_19590 [Smallanthus sonchifolius]
MGRFSWINTTQGWFLLSSPVSDSCVQYSLCGPYGRCEIEQSPPCKCLKGFTPKRPDQWAYGDWKSGCQREIPLDCGVGEGFRKYSFVKLPDTGQSWFDRSMTMEQCETKCRSECNCTAYATLDIKYGTGCLIWYRSNINHVFAVTQENVPYLPSFDMATLLSATTNFSEKNKIGEGGFGPVYKSPATKEEEERFKEFDFGSDDTNAPLPLTVASRVL